MEYSRIRNAVDREIHISGLTHGKLCALNGTGYYIIHVYIEGSFSAEFEIINKKIYTIRSFANSGTFRAGIDGNDFYFSSADYPGTLSLAVEYTTSGIAISNNTTAFGNTYSFGRLYILETVQFDGAALQVANADINALNVGNFTAQNATLNMANNAANIGTLNITQTKLNVLDVDTFNAKVIDCTKVTLGNWSITKGNNNTATITYSAD